MNLLTAAVASVVLLVQVTVSTSFATFHHATVARQRLSDASDVEKQIFVIQTSSSSSLKRQFALALANGADEKDYVSPMRQRKHFLHNTDPIWILFVANIYHPTVDFLPLTLMHRTSTCRWRYGLCK